jgi:hypothetical protein
MISFARRHEDVIDAGDLTIQGCARHVSEPGSGRCGRCSEDFCADCLVFPRGPRKPGLCIPCAMNKAGVPASPAGSRGHQQSHQALQRWR